jgi:hypothetical protein
LFTIYDCHHRNLPSGKTSLFNAKIFPTLAEEYGFQVFPTALVRGAWIISVLPSFVIKKDSKSIIILQIC